MPAACRSSTSALRCFTSAAARCTHSGTPIVIGRQTRRGATFGGTARCCTRTAPSGASGMRRSGVSRNALRIWISTGVLSVRWCSCGGLFLPVRQLVVDTAPIWPELGGEVSKRRRAFACCRTQMRDDTRVVIQDEPHRDRVHDVNAAPGVIVELCGVILDAFQP